MAYPSWYCFPEIPAPAAAPKIVTDAGKPNVVPQAMEPSPEDEYLSNSTHLTREEVLRRRSHNLKQLARCYRDHYWGLMDELRVRHRDYVWKYGKSPFVEENVDEGKASAKEEQQGDGIAEGIDETGGGNGGEGSSSYYNLLCAFQGCRLKAMALSRYCHLHILSDPRQQLYKPCEYVIKSAQAGPITCGKPTLRSSVPSLCSVHFQTTQRYVNRALRKAGSNVSSSNKLPPKLHVIVAEYVREIQKNRKAALRASKKNILPKLENDDQQALDSTGSTDAPIIFE